MRSSLVLLRGKPCGYRHDCVHDGSRFGEVLLYDFRVDPFFEQLLGTSYLQQGRPNNELDKQFHYASIVQLHQVKGGRIIAFRE